MANSQGHRQVRGLIWAALCERPKHIPIGRPRGQKAYGPRYERALERGPLCGATRGQWFAFLDLNGQGHCQTDFIINQADRLVVLECKYTWVPEGQRQIDQLYRPVLEKVFHKPVIGVVVCNRVVPQVDGLVFGDLDGAIRYAASGKDAIWHYAMACGPGPFKRQRSSGHHVGLALPGRAT